MSTFTELFNLLKTNNLSTSSRRLASRANTAQNPANPAPNPANTATNPVNPAPTLEQIHPTATHSANLKFNRFSNILPVEWSRVVVDPPPSSCSYSDYINANDVALDILDCTENYILTQAPLPVSIEAFWLMVWQKGSGVVLALNKLFEGGQRKGDVYWPTHTPTVKYGLMTIALLNTATEGDVTIRQLTIHNGASSEAPRKVFHISYAGWPDCGVPETTGCIREVAFLLFALQQYANFENECDGPPVIHCSAGVGRTGCFVALHYVLKSGLFWNIEFLSDLSRILKSEVEDVDTSTDLLLIHALSVFKISDIVLSLRQQRNPVTVQTAKQFEFIFQAIRDEILTPTSLDKVEKFIISFLQPIPNYHSAFPLLPNAWKSCRSQAENDHPPIVPTTASLSDE